MPNQPVPAFLVAVVASLVGTGALSAGEPALFPDHVAPLLEQRCTGCHNPTKKRGGLDLTTREGLLHGGDDGPVVKTGASATVCSCGW